MHRRAEQRARRAEADHIAFEAEHIDHLPGIAALGVGGEGGAAIGQGAGQAAREWTHRIVLQVGLLQQGHPLGFHPQAEHLPEAEAGHAAEQLLQQRIAGGIAGVEHRLLELQRPRPGRRQRVHPRGGYLIDEVLGDRAQALLITRLPFTGPGPTGQRRIGLRKPGNLNDVLGLRGGHGVGMWSELRRCRGVGETWRWPRARASRGNRPGRPCRDG